MGCIQNKDENLHSNTKYGITKQSHINNILNYISNPLRMHNNIFIKSNHEWLPKYIQTTNKNYWPEHEQQQLNDVLEKYLLESVQNEQQYRSTSQKMQLNQRNIKFHLASIFKQKLFELLNRVEFKNTGIYSALRIYQQIISPILIDMQIQRQQQQNKIKAVTQQIQSISQEFEQCYFLFSLFLVRSCIKLQQRNVSLFEINQRLEGILKFLNKDLISTPETQVKSQTLLLYHTLKDDQYYKYKSVKFNQNADIMYKKVGLRGNGEQKLVQLQNQIIELSKEASNQFQPFKQFLHNVLKNGKKLKIGLKLKNSSDFRSLKRIQQKIILKLDKSYKKQEKLDYRTIDQLIQKQRINKSNQIKHILESNQQIYLQITDLLRARCIYTSIQQINKAISDITNQIKQLKQAKFDIELIQIDNRLQKITSDLVLKIRIRKIITELQLVYVIEKYNFKNQMYHKVYEIARSKTLTSLYMLFQWHQFLAQKFISFTTNYLKTHPQRFTQKHAQIYQHLLSNSVVKPEVLIKCQIEKPVRCISDDNEVEKLLKYFQAKRLQEQREQHKPKHIQINNKKEQKKGSQTNSPTRKLVNKQKP